MMSSLQQAIARVRDGSSIYWGYYCPKERQADVELVEVRLNATPEKVAGFVCPADWELARVQWGDTLFLRRCQSLEPEAVEAMLVDMLELASAEGMRLHSWVHGQDVE